MLPETILKHIVGDSWRIRRGLAEAIRIIFPNQTFDYSTFPDWAQGMEIEYYCSELRMAIHTVCNDEETNALRRRICKENNILLVEMPSGLSFEEMVERLKAFSDDV